MVKAGLLWAVVALCLVLGLAAEGSETTDAAPSTTLPSTDDDVEQDVPADVADFTPEASASPQPSPAEDVEVATGESPEEPPPEEDEEEELAEDGQSKRINFAASSVGAILLASNPEAKHADNLLTDNSDEYFMSPSAAKKFVVVGLADEVNIDTIVIANYERYSSQVKEFKLLGSQTYPPVDKWHPLGTWVAEDTMGEQSFQVEPNSVWVRFVKLSIVSHYGDNFYCTLSSVQLFGVTSMDELQKPAALPADFPLLTVPAVEGAGGDGLPILEEVVVSDDGTPGQPSPTPLNSTEPSANATTPDANQEAAPEPVVEELPPSTVSETATASAPPAATSPPQPTKPVEDATPEPTLVAAAESVEPAPSTPKDAPLGATASVPPEPPADPPTPSPVAATATATPPTPTPSEAETIKARVGETSTRKQLSALSQKVAGVEANQANMNKFLHQFNDLFTNQLRDLDTRASNARNAVAALAHNVSALQRGLPSMEVTELRLRVVQLERRVEDLVWWLGLVVVAALLGMGVSAAALWRTGSGEGTGVSGDDTPMKRGRRRLRMGSRSRSPREFLK